MIDVNPNHLKTITRILAKHVPECEVRAFGSRVTWTAKDYSDLDLAVVGKHALEMDVFLQLKEAFEESDLPFRVDVLDWHAISSSFRKVIEGKYEVVQKGGKERLGVASDWRDTALGQVLELKRGYDLPQRDRNTGKVPLVSSSGITDHHSIAMAQGPGVVTGRYGTLGKVFYIREDFWPLNTTLYVRDFKGNDPRFISYFLGSINFLAYSDKAAVPGLNRNHLHQARVRLPADVLEQRAIAHILGTLDDKIELNRKMNETLEAIARALFKSWFIDFDPVHRNAARRQNQPSPPSPLPMGEGSRTREGVNYRAGYQFSGLVETARALRKKQTAAEEVFWELVRDRQFMNVKFRRQHQLGNYIADFYCHERRLVVEFDGGIHALKQKKDQRRDAWIKAQGFTILRFPNEQLFDDPELVLIKIADTIHASGAGEDHLRPLPLGEGRGEGSVEDFDRLFPDSFEYSELGKIPKGWEIKPLPDVIDVNPTRSLRKGEVAPYLDMANMPTRGHSPNVIVDRPFGSGMRFVNGDTLVARITPCLENGKTAYVDFLEDGQVGWGSTEYIVLRPRDSLPKTFAYCLARSAEFREFAIQSMTGSSGRQRVPADSLPHYRIARPSLPVAEKFGAIVDPLFSRAREAKEQSHALAALRNALLPKLISGKLRVKDARQFIGASV